ncbi:hypothetical protein GUJ93_ZPchr0006g43156 [Zizania palustris]|uniref:Uncharacterized protein n=1 Tax=Zizania palustris TaxID=103762 RepID=A0A8J5SPX6_ZIZPA|nr:hypothetical protein GUJ93_ZPchr0006g43156 [Zizania palustris]
MRHCCLAPPVRRASEQYLLPLTPSPKPSSSEHPLFISPSSSSRRRRAKNSKSPLLRPWVMSGDGKARKRSRAVDSACHSSKFDGVADVVGDTAKIIYKHCQDEEFKKIAGPSCKKHFQCSKDKCSIEKSEGTRQRWSIEENEVLIQMVNRHGLKNWQTIACTIPGRNAQQCKTRWQFTLDPAINKQEWSQHEELRLIRAKQIYGNKWCKMVEHFPGRTNYAIKQHWRGPMKRKLNSYLASGLLEQLPDLPESLSFSHNSDSYNAQKSEGSSDGKQLSSSLTTSSKSKQGLTELCGNTYTSEGECSKLMCAKGPDAHSGEVSQMIRDRLNERTRARKRLAFLSSPVELKVSAMAKSPRILQKIKKMTPDVSSISPLTALQDVSPEVPSECANVAIPPLAEGTKPENAGSSPAPGTSDPRTLELHQSNVSDLLDMSYCDGLMIIPPGCPSDDDDFI